jgi:hypothetical protein
MWRQVRVAAAILTVLAVLIVAGIAIGGPPGPKTWTIHVHETLTLPANEVHPDDLYRCEGWGAVNGTPDIGTAEVGGGGSLYVAHKVDGTVSMSCESGPVDWAFT